MKKLLILIMILFYSQAYASTVTIPTTYAQNGTVTSTNLNGNFVALANTINGGLDNDNANTTGGYRFYKTVAVLPAAGSQGSVYFLTSDNSLNFDTGSTFIKSVSVSSPSANQIPVYNGSSWVATNTSTFMPSGGIIMWSGTVATIPTGWVLCDGTNSTPDLRDKFIVGAKQDSSGAAKTNITGSLTQSGGSVTISTANLPASGLSYTVAADNGGTNSTVSFLGRSGSPLGTFTGTTGNMGSATAYTQPYYALAYIMKT